MKKIAVSLLCGAMLAGCAVGEAPTAPYEHCFDGLSNAGRNLDKMYVTAGRKAQIIGLQDASFPDLGGHVPGEMGGVWTASFKMADGYLLQVADVNSDKSSLLKAAEMVVYPHYTAFRYAPSVEGLEISSRQFASDHEPGVVVTYVIRNTSARKMNLKVGFHLNVDLSPVWFSAENGIVNDRDEVVWDKEREVFTGRDLSNDWYMTWGCNRKIESYDIGSRVMESQGLVTPTSMFSTLEIEAGEETEISYALASSVKGCPQSGDSYYRLLEHRDSECAAKEASIRHLLSHSVISIPDKEIEKAYYWTLINNRWLECDVENIGYFLSAGAVEYPWLFGCDNSYSLQGLLRTGNFELVKSTLRLLNEVSERANGNGRIIHEMSTNGFVGNRGNTQETAHYIVALWKTYEWTGDEALLREIYPNVRKSIDWLTNVQDTNRNLYPEGYGIMEVKGLNAELIDVAVYTREALACASRMARLMGDDALATEWSGQADVLEKKINDEFWDEDLGSYCDFYGSKSDALKVLKGAVEQLKFNPDADENTVRFYTQSMERIRRKYPQEVSRGWCSNVNWVVSVPMECGIAPRERALRALENVYQKNCGEYGPYLSAVEKLHMMTISTGVQAVAEANYGRIDRALEYVGMIARTLGRNMPGAINEMMPDYGCPYQAWTVYGMPVTLISGCFGVEPFAPEKRMELRPQWPESWKEMSLGHLRVGDNFFDVKLKKSADGFSLDYASEQSGWKTVLSLEGLDVKQVSVDGDVKQMVDHNKIVLEGRKANVVVTLN